jgi:flagellar hook assembly protein FlgD
LSNFSVYPNPFRNEMRVSFSMGHGADGTALIIYDAAGRIVRTIEQGSLVWDGRDDAGKTVAPGVYFFADAYGNGLEKVVKLR